MTRWFDTKEALVGLVRTIDGELGSDTVGRSLDQEQENIVAIQPFDGDDLYCLLVEVDVDNRRMHIDVSGFASPAL